MKILKAIGGFFVKIWRWIKNTAWVQPLLIVGAIFGVIFSIPAISTGIQNLINGANSADTYYHKNQLSLQGKENSAAEKLIQNYNNYTASYEKCIEEGKTWDPSTVKAEERKFFLMFTSSNNSITKDIKTGFETLSNNWGTLYPPVNQGEQFRLYTIFTDEVTTSTTPVDSAFSQFLGNTYSFFEDASSVGLESNYFLNTQLNKEEYTNLATPGPDNFKIPTLILVDWNLKVTADKAPGITQVVFDVPGANGYSKASFLYNCWNNKEDFAPKN